jgi:hypothetical protein
MMVLSVAFGAGTQLGRTVGRGANRGDISSLEYAAVASHKRVYENLETLVPKKTYIQLGEELAAHDGQTSFKAHARKLGVTRTAAYRLIRSAEVARLLEQAGLPIPRRESQARILHELLSESDQRIAAWKAAIEAGKGRVTAALVRSCVQHELDVQAAEKAAAIEKENAQRLAQEAALDPIVRLDKRMAALIAKERDEQWRAEKLEDWALTRQKYAQGEMLIEEVGAYVKRAELIVRNPFGFTFGKGKAVDLS